MMENKLKIANTAPDNMTTNILYPKHLYFNYNNIYGCFPLQWKVGKHNVAFSNGSLNFFY